MGILKVLFYIVLIGFIGGNVTRLQLGNTVGISLLDLSVSIFVSYWVVWKIVTKKGQKHYALTRPIVLFIFVAVISLLANITWLHQQIAIAALYLVRWMLYGGIYFAIQDFDTRFRDTIAKLLLWVGGCMLIVGYVQYFSYANLRNLYYLGWDDHVNRLFSSFLDPNFAGAFFVLFLLMALHRLFEQKLSHKRLYQTITVGAFVAVVLAYSRTALIMFIIGVSSMLLLHGKKRWIGWFIGLCCLGLLALSATFTLESTNLLRTASTNARIQSIQHAGTIIMKHPIIGVGFNAYRYAQQKYQLRPVETQFPSHADAGTDNSFLFIFATTGIIGLASYAYLIKKVIDIGRSKKHYHYLQAVLLASIGCLLVGSLFNNLLFYPFLMAWMWMLVGLTERK